VETGYAGGCLCGAVRYECTGEPAFSGNCHCADCRRSSGGAFAPAMMFNEAQVRLTGTPRYYRSLGDSGRWIERGFCPDCGSQLFTRLEAFPGVLGVKAGSLDDPSRFQPVLDFYVASAPPWDHMSPTLPKRPGSPRG
jgi:hypothetical protein